MSARLYPRLRVALRSHSVLVGVDSGHREYQLRRMWTVLYVRPRGAESVMWISPDPGIYGWVKCIDWAHGAIAKARSER